MAVASGVVPRLVQDRVLSEDIRNVRKLIQDGDVVRSVKEAQVELKDVLPLRYAD